MILSLNTKVVNNFTSVKSKWLIPFFFLLFTFCICFILFKGDGTYVSVQKELFLSLNAELSQLPNLQFNLTQLGDVLIFLPFLGLLVLYAPKLWEALIPALLVSAIFSGVLKKLFSIPRPAAVFNHDNFTIIGETLTGRTSLPSGHSIATFTIVMVILLAFIPQKKTHKKIWFVSVFLMGLIIAISRVGVGAHYPLDVLIGSFIGCKCAVIGIVISNKTNWFSWVGKKKFLPIFMLLFLVCAIIIVIKRLPLYKLAIFYASLFSVVITLYFLVKTYVKK